MGLSKKTKIEDIPKYMKFEEREILIDNLTPQIADNIDELIRFWNLFDKNKLLALKDRQPIKIYINSLGGSLDAALTLISSIQLSKTPIYTINTGTAYKESFLVYLAGHRRYAYPNSMFMYIDTSFENDNNNESNFYSKNLITTKIQNDIKLFFLEKVNGITETQYDKHKGNELWFTATDAFKIHICDEIIRSHYQD